MTYMDLTLYFIQLSPLKEHYTHGLLLTVLIWARDGYNEDWIAEAA